MKISDLECVTLDECLTSLKRKRRVRYQGEKRYRYEQLSNKQKHRVLEILGRRLLTEGDN